MEEYESIKKILEKVKQKIKSYGYNFSLANGGLLYGNEHEQTLFKTRLAELEKLSKTHLQKIQEVEQIIFDALLND